MTENGTRIVVDGNGKEVVFHGIGWYGLNLAKTIPAIYTDTSEAVAMDFEQIVYRQRQLGFNSVRLAFTFDATLGIQAPVLSYTQPCSVSSVSDFKNMLRPNSSLYTNYEVPTGWVPPENPPVLGAGMCNLNLPNSDTYTRFLYIINYYVKQGFYVNLDFHSTLHQETVYDTQPGTRDMTSWIKNWSQLVTDVMKTPANQGKILINLMNEPDSFGFVWEGVSNTSFQSLTSYYVNAIDALYPICPDCLYLLEGTGQDTYCGVNWGNGFITDPAAIHFDSKGRYFVSDASSLFDAIFDKPWVNQVVLNPHIYCPAVSNAKDCFAGESRYKSLDVSFGYLSVEPGYCKNRTDTLGRVIGTDCRVFPVILGEFGSFLNSSNETLCMQSIENYVNVQNLTTHAPIKSWFYWAWQPNSYGTGGILEDDWKSISWAKVGALTGGTKDFVEGFGLKPWYLRNGWASLIKKNSTSTRTVSGNSIPQFVDI